MEIPRLHQLLVCRPLLSDPILRHLVDFFDGSKGEDAAYDFAATLLRKAERWGLAGNVVSGYLLCRLVLDENLVAGIMEQQKGRVGKSVRAAFVHDIALLEPLLREHPSTYLPFDFLDAYVPTGMRVDDVQEGAAALFAVLSRPWTADSLADALIDHYQRYGSGDIALYRAFRWDREKKLVGIENFAPIRLTNLIGYMEQKQALLSNTLAFLSGRPANNVLLVGARGTGKSSSVKALANEFFRQGLRLVQLTKSEFSELPRIMRTLRRFATKHFIVYLDDLSFEESDPEYKTLKSGIEGGVETRPDNVLLYATSNRHHLIKESWHDRDGADDVHRNDSVNETISLSDRFGLVIDYRAPNEKEYLAIIDHYLRAADVTLTPEELRLLGQRWEMGHSGLSGRAARQFVDHYLGQKKASEEKKP
ncbi:MAG: ATP-binding protein [Schwartzia sp. (in: firmicutes)]